MKVRLVHAAVLAGGLSSRMGCDKRFLRLGSESLLERALRLGSQAIQGNGGRVFLCGQVPDRECVPDLIAGRGPLGGLYSVISRLPLALPSVAPWLLVLPVDMPQLNVETLRALLLEIGKEEPAGAIAYRGFEMPFVIRCDLRASKLIQSAIGAQGVSQRSIRALLEALDVRMIELRDLSRRCMLNANTPADWENVGMEGVN